MFEPSSASRFFGMPPGVDFASSLVSGLELRLEHAAPADWARVEVYVNTTRMRRRIREIFDQGPARLLPRIRLITDLANDPAIGPDIKPISSLERRLEMSRLVGALIDLKTVNAPRSALFDLSDSLAKLMDEMQGEGLSPKVFDSLNVENQSEFWQNAKKFLQIIAPFFGGENELRDPQARQRFAVMRMIAEWRANPPTHPIILAGSTGSRGATSLLMQAIAKLPQGAVILPGFDTDLPEAVWNALEDRMISEDHPQYRFYRLLSDARVAPQDVATWTDDAPPVPARNRMMSLSLRPAPVTDQWLTDGPALGDLAPATAAMTLVEAQSPRAEATAIALRLRQAAQQGITAALITPDRMLTRQVAAALDLWDIRPDDSAGTPLPLSAPGRFLRHCAELMGTRVRAEDLLVILKHPLCHTAHNGRNQHLLNSRMLEMHIRKHGIAFPDVAALEGWAKGDSKGRDEWVAWLASCLAIVGPPDDCSLEGSLSRHILLATRFAKGPSDAGSGALWDKAAGREAWRLVSQLKAAATSEHMMSLSDYRALFGSVMADGVVRDRDAGHPNILIWGALEARVQGADLVILGGMNEGSWPEAPPPDPWLNRTMRKEAGLPLPERRIGLSAHDYQQAIAAKEVWITRAKRSSDSETVPSRWINRLTNLLDGLPDQNGPNALAQMRRRGDIWLNQARYLDTPQRELPRATRPSPCPPADARPRKISVTQVKTLIRDPFAIYAEKVLRLSALDPLSPSADAALRGTIYHRILEDFSRSGTDPADPVAVSVLLAIAQDQLDQHCPWPGIRAQWLARLTRVAPHFITDEAQRRQDGSIALLEGRGELAVPEAKVTLVCKADRIDLSVTGHALIYDYKTGAIPSEKQQLHFDKQLLLEAAMVERGAFAALGQVSVDRATFVDVGIKMANVDAPLHKAAPDEVWAQFQTLMIAWQQPDRGYTARLALFSKDQAGYYDHLARFGEWTMSDHSVSQVLT